MKLLSIILLAVTLCAAAFGQSPLFSTNLPVEIDGKTDLWVARLDPTTAEPDGAIFMVQRQFLKRYAVARESGFPWSWAPLPDVLKTLSAKTRWKLTWQDVPPELRQTNPHTPATAEYWAWMKERAKTYPRFVVIMSTYPSGDPVGWVTPESTLGAHKSWIEKPDAYWFYVGETGGSASTTAGPNPRLLEEVSALKDEAQRLQKRIREAVDLLSLEIPATETGPK